MNKFLFFNKLNICFVFVIFCGFLILPCYAEQVFSYNNKNQFDVKALNNLDGQQGSEVFTQEKTRVYIIPLKNAEPDEIRTNLMDLYPNILIGVNNSIKAITLNTNYAYYKELLRVIKKLDKPKIMPKKDIDKIELYTINLKNSLPKDVKQSILGVFPNLLISTDDRTRSVTFRSYKNNYEEIASVIKRLDRSLPQIKIEVQILEVNYSSFDQYKSIFSDLTDGFSINYDFQAQKIQGSLEIDGVIAYLLNTGNAKILAKPSISTIENQKASFKVGDQVPYVSAVIRSNTKLNEVKFIDTGIELEILPKVTSSNEICAEINTTITNVKIWKEISDFIYPVLSTRKTQTKVNIKNKKTLVIAGLLNEETKINEKKVPILGDLFLIGDLFKGRIEEKVKTDVVFIITPEIF